MNEDSNPTKIQALTYDDKQPQHPTTYTWNQLQEQQPGKNWKNQATHSEIVKALYEEMNQILWIQFLIHDFGGTS